MGRSLPLLQQSLLLPVALAALCVGVAAQGQPMPSAGTRSAEKVRGSPETGPAPEPAPAPNLPIQRYKVKLLPWQGSAYESWIVFVVRGGTTILLFRHATTDGFRWWDHPVLSAQACRIIQADGGDRLADCVRAVRDVPTTPLRIELPQAVSLQNLLLTFTWMESGRIQEGLIRMEHGLIPDVHGMGPPQKPEVINQPLAEPITLDANRPDQAVITPHHVDLLPPDSRSWRYKVKLSPGHAWQNLKPESWVVFDVIRGTTITIKHSTNSYNIITGFSRWWDHPIRSITACPLHPSEGSDRPAGCLQGSSAAPGEPLRILLPVGTSLHDYRFAFTWEENGRIQEGATIVDHMLQPNAIPLP